MIRNVTIKPTVVLSFRPISIHEKVAWWVDVNAKGKNLSSDAAVLDATTWSPEVYAKLSTLDEAHSSAVSVRDNLWETRPPKVTHTDMEAYVTAYPGYVGKSTHVQLQEGILTYWRFTEAFGQAHEEQKRLSDELKSHSALMASQPFMHWLAEQAILLKVNPDDTDERSYALYRGSVWSCSRALEVGQWQILVDRIIKTEEAQLASALAEESGTSETRERISPEVRRAVWNRDQGKCARCGSRERLEFDHIVPVSRGGSNTERNIELLCEVCNRAKSDSIT